MSKFIVLILIVFVIVARYYASIPRYKEGQKLRITSTLTSEPSIYGNRQRFSAANLTVWLPRFPEVHYGDRVVVEGEVHENTLSKAVLVDQSQTSNILITLKENLVGFWQRTLPEPHASLVAGIVLGYKSSLSQEFRDALRSTGTSHVVVASGMNVTFVAAFLISVTTKLIKRRKAIIFSILGIITYCIITGLEAPIVRAAIMSILTFTGQVTGRVVNSLRMLVISALVMLIIKPLWITDVGFLLSFFSTFSLILFGTKVSSRLQFVPGIFRESISTSLAAQVGSAPILFVTFGRLNILSPVINALVLWVIPFIMIIGIVGGLVGLVLPVFGQLITYLVYPLTSWFIFIIESF